MYGNTQTIVLQQFKAQIIIQHLSRLSLNILQNKDLLFLELCKDKNQ